MQKNSAFLKRYNFQTHFVTKPPFGQSDKVMPTNTMPTPAALAKNFKSSRRAVFTFTIKPQPGEGIPQICERVANQLRIRQAAPLHLIVLGNVSASTAGMKALEKSLGRVEWPVTWVEGSDCKGLPIAGIQVHAYTGKVDRISIDGQVYGSVFTDGGARQCVVGGLSPADKTISRSEQTRLTLEKLQAVLGKAGFELADTVRTWFYLENILAWYDDFNIARNKIYSAMKFRSGSIPASTGVAAKNPTGTALALVAWAFRPLEKDATAEEIASPLQCPAPAYGSAFSRAMELTSPAGERRMFISGTASIAPGGKTEWVGDIRKQIDLTMEVVEAILRSRGMTFTDFTRATAYFRHPADVGVFAEWLAANGLEQMPVISAQCDVCRDDLLFELEADAEA